jgi:cold shock CspA family protein
MLPFQEDSELARHLAAQQPKPAPARRQHHYERISRMGAHQGTVSLYDCVRHFGFVSPDTPTVADGADLFVAGAMLRRCGLKPLRRGDRISFDVTESRKHPGKYEATNIALVDQAQAA